MTSYRMSIGFGVLTLLFSILNLVFYFGITHHWLSLAVALVAVPVGLAGVLVGLWSRSVIRRL